uniref:Gem nuclear organelle associated protein 5 n=1 Tax=Myripristis murdjan TaxID=586833 RepID=A0A667Y1U1_9TELE
MKRSLPASPNWYCSRCSDVSDRGVLAFGARSVIHLAEVSASGCTLLGELVGHKETVSGFSFCHHAGQSHMCVSGSGDGSVIFWDSDKDVCLVVSSTQSPVSAVHWSPVDRNLVVSADEKGVVVCHWYHTGDSVSFFPEPRTVFCLSCSPHTWNHVAVGYKDGMIVLIDVSRKGEVLHRLRGHDDEIHSLAWAPTASEESLYVRPEELTGTSEPPPTNGVTDREEKGCFLASGSKDQTVRIWSTAKGKGVMTLKLPYLKRRGSGVDPAVKERLWLSVHWPKGRPTQLVSSCFSGEMVMWDLTRSGKQKWSLFGSSSEGQNHSRIVFNMSSVCLQDDSELLISTSMDREVKCWDLASLECCWTLPTLGGFVYALTFSPVGAGCLALGVGDSMIRVWNTLSIQNQYDTRSFWQGIKSKVTALAWHPKKEGSLSFGTDDGKVGIYDVFSNKPPQISSSYHRKTVYTLAWGPPVPPMSFGAVESKPSYSLYSCAGEGVILQHDPCKLSGEASDIDKLIRDTNSIKHKLSPHTDLSWKPNGKVVAIGNEDGSIDVYQAPSLKLLCSIQQHHKIINTLRWHHDHSSQPELHYLLASGSSNAKVYVHNLRSIIESPADSPVVLTEPYRRLCGHTTKITGMAWSPHHDGRLVTVCYDGTAQVWDVQQEAAVCNYRGHVGPLLCVDWSPVDPDVVWTGGRDFTVQEWRLSKQEFTKPPKGKKMLELVEKMKVNPKKKKNKKAGGATPAEILTPSVNGERGRGGETAAAREELSEDEEADGSSTSSSVKSTLHLLSMKKRKPRSMLPLSTSMDHRSKEELLQDCITLATVTNSQGECASPVTVCVGEHIHLGLFSDRQALYRMFEAEEEGHVEAGHYDSVTYLRLWSGDLEGALRVATERGELSDHLLSIAPMAGYAVWCRTVEAYVKQLCLQEQYLKAASHLLSINKVYEAVQLLHSHKMYREAIALVKARLPADEPVLKELYSSWAVVLEKDGHLSSAAKCYLAAGASFDAAKVIAKKNDVSSLRTAASLARICGEAGLAQSLSLRCAKDLAVAQDWVGAQEVLGSQDSLLVHRLHVCVTELLTAMLAEAKLVNWSSVSGHPWASPGGRHSSIQDRIREVWQEEFGVSESSAAPGSIPALLQELKAVESPQPSTHLPLKQVLRLDVLDVPRFTFRGLAVSRIFSCAILHAFFFFTGLMFLRSVCSRKYPKILRHTEEQAKAAANSLQAFVHYYLLYERWWELSSPSKENEVKDKVVNGGSSEPEVGVCPATQTCVNEKINFDASVLLSEDHAACQAIRRSVAEIQERLAAMVAQHSSGQQLDPDMKQADHVSVPSHHRPDEQESLMSLSTKMSEYHKKLAELPDTVKMYPHPDLTECCLVLLYLGKWSNAVSDSQQQDARDLLRKYGASYSIQNAARQFLT